MKLKDLMPGTWFRYLNRCYIKLADRRANELYVNFSRNSVDLATGNGTWMEPETEVTKIAARIEKGDSELLVVTEAKPGDFLIDCDFDDHCYLRTEHFVSFDHAGETKFRNLVSLRHGYTLFGDNEMKCFKQAKLVI